MLAFGPVSIITFAASSFLSDRFKQSKVWEIFIACADVAEVDRHQANQFDRYWRTWVCNKEESYSIASKSEDGHKESL